MYHHRTSLPILPPSFPTMRSLLILLLLGLIAITAVQATYETSDFLTLEELDSSDLPSLSELDSALDVSDHEIELDDEEHDDAFLETEAETESESESESEVDREHVKPWHRDAQSQPVDRYGAEITCIDGDCVRAKQVHKAKIGDHPTPTSRKPRTKLEKALDAVKEEIMVRAKELHKEKDWSKKVADLIDEYQQKLSKVTGNIVHLREQTKALLRKKKQIQNVQVQNKLKYKLKLAEEDLKRLQMQMEHIAGKENEFSDTEKQLKQTMNALKNSLLKLRGQETKKLALEGI